MRIVKVSGKNNRHKVLMYAISTCAWCKMTKKFLKDGDVEYEYVDVDLCDEEDREKIRRGILDRGGSLSYPTIIIDDKILITGFRKDRLTEVLEIDNLGKSATKG
jgi:glutaredoxin